MSDVKFLVHHGIKGQKWGVRRYQNLDGSYTNLGRSRKKEDGNKKSNLSEDTKRKLKTAGKVALGIGAAAAVGYGAYKLGNSKTVRSSFAKAAASSKMPSKNSPRARYKKLSDDELVRRIGRIEQELKLEELERKAYTTEGARHMQEAGWKGLDKAVSALTAGTAFAVTKHYMEDQLGYTIPRMDKK